MSYWKSLLQIKVPVTQDPRLLPIWRKRLLLGLVCFIAIIPGFCSTIYVRVCFDYVKIYPNDFYTFPSMTVACFRTGDLRIE
jgi:hypothetical protein